MANKVNQVQTRLDAGLGAWCHMKNGSVPVAVITDLEGNIIVNNDTLLEIPLPLPDAAPGVTAPLPPGAAIVELATQAAKEAMVPGAVAWVISGMKAMVTRMWSAATATTILTCPIPDMGDPPPLVPEQLLPERDLCIWQGYIDTIRPVTKSDLLNNSLLRVFVGVVDTIQAINAGGGYTLTITYRDRIRWLMDTSLTYDVAAPHISGGGPLRSTILLEIAQRGIGFVPKDLANNPASKSLKQILQPPAGSPYFLDIAEGLGDPATPANAWYIKPQQPGYNPALAGRTTNNLDTRPVMFNPDELKLPGDPEFRIFTTRQKVDVGKTYSFFVNQQKPIDMLKLLSFQEVYPSEVFQDHRDGNFYYCPRAYDASSLDDPKRFYRTYFYKIYPDSFTIEGHTRPITPPDFNQMLISFREEQSSVGLITDFILHRNSLVDNVLKDDWMIHLRIPPQGMPNRYAAKYMKIYDQTVANPAQAAGVLLNAASIYGRQLRVATMVTFGDPSFTPGEIVQVIGSSLQNNSNMQETIINDRNRFKEFSRRYYNGFQTVSKTAREDKAGDQPFEMTMPDNSVMSVMPQPLNPGLNGEPISGANAGSGNVNDILSNSKSSLNTSTREEEPKTIYRVEAVLHKFNIGSKGFTTELALTSPF